MRSLLRARRAVLRMAPAAMAGCLALVAGCSAAGGAGGGGTVSVAYAGSLTYLNEKVLGPAFTRATGDTPLGRAAGSDALAAEIASGEITPDVFISVGAGPITALTPKYTRWYIRYASSPIVVAYSPASKYASDFRAIAAGQRPLSELFTLMAQPGFQLGRTDPNVDPQGRAFIYMLELARTKYHLPAGMVTKILRGAPGSASSSEIFSETSLEPRLQAGQLDAASAFRSQAIQLHLPYITLPAAIDLGDPALAARYARASVTITAGGKAVTMAGQPLTLDITMTGGADRAAAQAYVRFVLSSRGRRMYQQGGYTLLPPKAFGDVAAIPTAIRHELGS